ncbi:MAG: hypothetical protein HY901_20470, partial [Deltaproteobacteria bacterium]|nr:hypothetical protein [Deltaproteobacteria bacterium]
MTPGRVLFATALLLVAAGVGARLWSARLEADGLELAARSRDAAAAFTQSLVGEHHDAELALLDQRRERMVHAAWWGRGGMLAFGVAVLALLAAWVVTWGLSVIWARDLPPNILLAPLPPVLLNAFGVALYLAPLMGVG